MLVHNQNLETVFDKSGTSQIISSLMLGQVGDGSVCIIDETSLAGIAVELFNDLAVNLYGSLP